MLGQMRLLGKRSRSLALRAQEMTTVLVWKSVGRFVKEQSFGTEELMMVGLFPNTVDRQQFSFSQPAFEGKKQIEQALKFNPQNITQPKRKPNITKFTPQFQTLKMMSLRPIGGVILPFVELRGWVESEGLA